MSQQTATAAMEGRRKRGRSHKRWRDEVEEGLNIMEMEKQTGNGHTPSGMEEDFIGSQGPQQKEKK